MKLLKHHIILLSALALSCLIVGCSETKGEYIAYEKGIFDNGISIEYTLSEENGDTATKLKIDPEKSALVIVDLWQEKFLDSITINYINPLIQEFKDLGGVIIYAPSQNAQNTNLLMLEESVSFYDLEMMDDYLKDKGIKNVFYTGFDTFHCVLDKPNGIYSLQSRNNDLKLFLLKDGVTSFTKEMKQASIELLKKNGVGIVGANKVIPEFPFSKKTITNLAAKTKKEVRRGNNFVLIFEGKKKDSVLERFENELKTNQIPYGVVRDNRMFHLGEEISSYDFIKLLRDTETYNLYYSGFHLNNEMLWGDFGLTSLYIKVRYKQVKGLPWPYFITDLSYIDPSETMDPHLEKATIINHYRWANNITSNTLLNGIKSAKTKDEPVGIQKTN